MKKVLCILAFLTTTSNLLAMESKPKLERTSKSLFTGSGQVQMKGLPRKTREQYLNTAAEMMKKWEEVKLAYKEVTPLLEESENIPLNRRQADIDQLRAVDKKVLDFKNQLIGENYTALESVYGTKKVLEDISEPLIEMRSKLQNTLF